MTLTHERTRQRREENTRSVQAPAGDETIVLRNTPVVGKAVELIREHPSLTGEKDLSAAADPETRKVMARAVVRNAPPELMHYFTVVSEQVSCQTIFPIVRSILEKAAAA